MKEAEIIYFGRAQRGAYKELFLSDDVLQATRVSSAQAFSAEISHDGYCPELIGGKCDCEATIKIRPADTETL
jgi:hypothetical protein